MKRTLAFLLIALPGFAGDPWRGPSSGWTEQDARNILRESPWARPVGRSNVTARWETARPVRLALEILKVPRRGADCQTCYAIAVVGLPAAELGRNSEATLKATGRDAVAAYDVRVEGDTVVFLFPRDPGLSEPIVFRLPIGVKFGNDVQFRARIGERVVRQKFSIGSMSYQGKLEL